MFLFLGVLESFIHRPSCVNAANGARHKLINYEKIDLN